MIPTVRAHIGRAHIGRSPGRSTLPVVASSGQQCQCHIHTARAHIGRYISPFILLELILTDQLADLPQIVVSIGQEW